MSLARKVVGGALVPERLTLSLVRTPLSVLGTRFGLLQFLFDLLPHAGKRSATNKIAASPRNVACDRRCYCVGATRRAQIRI
jgi:hypothetical protein